MERLTEELRDNTLTIRMLPIGSTFSKYRRLVRDLSQSMDKEIEMKTQGAETELDKTVIEKLGDPLVHLLRNSIDHGIESPQEREAAGKPRQGTLELAAEHSGDSVLIHIRDDGKGLDAQKLRAKAIERGVIAENDDRSESELQQLIFAPGFSTAAQVSDVSGRGVGMDVVKRTIEALRGSIEIDSTLGVGTTVTLRLPLTLAIVDSLLVRVAAELYLLPLAAVEECVELRQEDIDAAHGKHWIHLRGELVPYLPLRQQFAITDTPPQVQQVIVARVNRKRIGFVVDHVVGQYQSVIKSLGPLCRQVQGFSGASILGDGNVALIVDLEELTQQHRLEVSEA